MRPNLECSRTKFQDDDNAEVLFVPDMSGGFWVRSESFTAALERLANKEIEEVVENVLGDLRRFYNSECPNPTTCVERKPHKHKTDIGT